jgi:hypothetical protein
MPRFGGVFSKVDMTPIRHKLCGSIFAWYIGDPKETMVRSSDALLLDGQAPRPNSLMACPQCGTIDYFSGKRCFDEDLTPDFDVDEAMLLVKPVISNP